MDRSYQFDKAITTDLARLDSVLKDQQNTLDRATQYNTTFTPERRIMELQCMLELRHLYIVDLEKLDKIRQTRISSLQRTNVYMCERVRKLEEKSIAKDERIRKLKEEIANLKSEKNNVCKPA
jgi:hypothetical protein